MPNNSKLPEVKLTDSQQKLLDHLTEFVFHSTDRVFILKGYAGTGKTTLMKFLIEDLQKNKREFKLLSTTGRAAKILANYTGHETSTIHSLIYKFKDFNKDVSDFDPNKDNVDTTGQLFLVFEPSVLSNEDRESVIYIVDEASMLSDFEEKDITQARFGSGRVLKELLEYDNLPESKFIFVGDPCQLPPVLGNISPALDVVYFDNEFSTHAQEGVLTEIMRQDNSIISAGNYLRKLWEKTPKSDSNYPPGNFWGPALQLSSYADIQIKSDMAELEEAYLKTIKKQGYNEAIFICSSNSQCYKQSAHFRAALGFTGSVQKGDLLLVVQNQATTGLMNGDMVEVMEVANDKERTMRNVMSPNGYHSQLFFREITVRELFTQRTITTLLLENILDSEQVNLDSRQQSGLFLDFILRMKQKGIDKKRNKKEFENAMMKDPYLNALRCNYGYAMTCHKAQGGEWNSVFIQMPRNITLRPTKNKYQWFYTALTRAKITVHLSKDFFIC